MKRILAIFCCATMLWSCGGNGEGEGTKKVAKGPVAYGGVLRVNEVEDFKNLFPQSINEVASHHIASQIYEGLLKLDSKDLTVKPCLAESWEINENATLFTFKIRKGVKFHDDPSFSGGEGRELKAQDVKYCLDKLCEASTTNQGYFLFENRVKGANEYFKSTAAKKPLPEGVSGVKVIDDYTLQIELVKSYAGFLYLLTMQYAWIFPKEAFEKYGMDMRTKGVGTGPFIVKDVKEGEAVILARNENYWDQDQYGNKLPYLDAIKFSFIKEKKAELLEFRKGNLDLVHQLPLEMIDEVIGELDDAKAGGNPSFTMEILPAFTTQYYGFQTQSDVFKDKRVRQALCYAVDREAIINFTLKGEGTPAKFGFVPPFTKEFDNKKIKGFSFDPDLAKKYLAEAGYPNGKGFPVVELVLNSGGTRNTQVAEVVQKMLKENLNIDIKLNVVPFAQHIENMENGKSVFFRAAWVGDFPDPESFLNNLYGGYVPESMSEKSFVNHFRFKNAKFDSVFKMAQSEADIKKRMDLLVQADQIIVDEAPLMPLFYDENTWMISMQTKNMKLNAMNTYHFNEVFMEQKKAAAPAASATSGAAQQEEENQ